jgi:hypothetical protein
MGRRLMSGHDQMADFMRCSRPTVGVAEDLPEGRQIDDGRAHAVHDLDVHRTVGDHGADVHGAGRRRLREPQQHVVRVEHAVLGVDTSDQLEDVGCGAAAR